MAMGTWLKERGGELETPWADIHGYHFRAAWRSKAVPEQSPLSSMEWLAFCRQSGWNREAEPRPYWDGASIFFIP